ncbi:signal peptidase II [Amycolatopsis alkalitolerans]|uniref:Lipoprotein signal peptidase n=1 Tax=Amycolatopsis alkalitolerans TaxID=2547244 RepID=A0A5C4LXH9_9PSEU|nr:signal peptidase II [Amycolatopsis alkalitolerans]TNC22665.1 signal peptidase II [Amycolatopsis alkalitolerans]
MSTEQGSQPETETGQATPPRRRVLLLACVAVVALALDIVSKLIVVSTLTDHAPVRILGGAVYLQLVRNAGAAFSMATGLTWVFALVAIAVAGAVIWFAGRLRSIGWAIGLGLVLAGALGNLVDRLFRAPGPLRGHVIDFISVFGPNAQYFPVFNLADSCITVGGALIVLLSLLGIEYDGTRRGRK